MPLGPAWICHPQGITTVDARYTRRGYAAVHLIEREGRAAIVDSGTVHSVPHVLAALDALEISPEHVDFLFITHVHLDHAGGAGALLEELPHAQVLAHPRAVPHLVDPARLIAASREVYGEERFAALYGTPLAIDAARVAATCDGDTVTLGGSELRVLHTPGHALHHHVLHDVAAASVFVGDTFGLSYRLLDTERGPYVLPTTTPSQFDPDQLLTSVERIVLLQPAALYLTHYGRVTGAADLGAALSTQIRDLVAIAREHAASDQRERRIREAIWARWLEGLRAHGCQLEESVLLELLANDLELNAQGLVAWLERSARSQ